MTLPLVFVSQWDNAILYQVILDYILPFHSIQLFLDRIILSFRKPLHVNEHTTGRNILTENYHTQQKNADSIKLQINLVSDRIHKLIKIKQLILN
jgi:hypothetical protein